MSKEALYPKANVPADRATTYLAALVETAERLLALMKEYRKALEQVDAVRITLASVQRERDEARAEVEPLREQLRALLACSERAKDAEDLAIFFCSEGEPMSAVRSLLSDGGAA